MFIILLEGETPESFPAIFLDKQIGFPLAPKWLLLGTSSLWPHCLSTTGSDLHLNLVSPVHAFLPSKPLWRTVHSEI